jgi:putative flippase GtrA
MRSKIQIEKFLRYITTGAFTNLLGYGFFLFLLFAGLDPVLCTISSFFFTLTSSYIVNRNWTFQSKSSHSRDVPRYLVAYLIGLMVAISGMHIFLKVMHPALAQILIIGLASFFIYMSLELLRFGRGKVKDAN